MDCLGLTQQTAAKSVLAAMPWLLGPMKALPEGQSGSVPFPNGSPQTRNRVTSVSSLLLLGLLSGFVSSAVAVLSPGVVPTAGNVHSLRQDTVVVGAAMWERPDALTSSPAPHSPKADHCCYTLLAAQWCHRLGRC
jgi:hypothetical protein